MLAPDELTCRTTASTLAAAASLAFCILCFELLKLPAASTDALSILIPVLIH